jgi:hypothetical protein
MRQPWRVLERLMLLFAVLRVACRSHREVAVENLLLRQQLTVALRTRRAPARARRSAGATGCSGWWPAACAPTGAGTSCMAHLHRHRLWFTHIVPAAVALR